MMWFVVNLAAAGDVSATEATTNLWSNFWSMGGHGLYVWSSYGLSLVVIVALVWQVRAAGNRFRRHAQARAARASDAGSTRFSSSSATQSATPSATPSVTQG